MKKVLMLPILLIALFISVVVWFLPTIFCYRIYKKNKYDPELKTFSNVVLAIGILLALPALLLSFLIGTLMLLALLTFLLN